MSKMKTTKQGQDDYCTKLAALGSQKVAELITYKLYSDSLAHEAQLKLVDAKSGDCHFDIGGLTVIAPKAIVAKLIK